jgi:hypothetical protein
MVVQGGGIYTTITSINTTPAPPTNTPTITLAQPVPPGPLSFLPAPPPNASGPPWTYASSTAEYRIIRAPRVLTGETPLQLPAGICIDPGAKYSGDPYAITTAPFDIMFSPQGGVLNSGGRDATILWVRDYTKDVSYPATTWPPPGQPGDQFLILIQTHTGFIAEHPVNLSPGSDPYLFTRDARSSGM